MVKQIDDQFPQNSSSGSSLHLYNYVISIAAIAWQLGCLLGLEYHLGWKRTLDLNLTLIMRMTMMSCWGLYVLQLVNAEMALN